jgi:hypothetical protein
MQADFCNQKILQLLLQNSLVVKHNTTYGQKIDVELFVKTQDIQLLTQLICNLFGTDNPLTIDSEIYYI